jgi:hypothetical protein
VKALRSKSTPGRQLVQPVLDVGASTASGRVKPFLNDDSKMLAKLLGADPSLLRVSHAKGEFFLGYVRVLGTTPPSMLKPPVG